jgi:predicted nucleotidyltransferase
VHAGHENHIAMTRLKLGGDCAVLCVMSGDFVQRGEAAVFEKYTRARAAVESGADLVLSLPVHVSLSSAYGFALGSVRLLNALGVADYLSFGSECGDLQELAALSDALRSGDAISRTREAMDKGLSYASARQLSAQDVLGTRAETLKTPNNLLGVMYLDALRETGSGITPVTIRRDPGVSASDVRALLRSGGDWRIQVPQPAMRVFEDEIENGRGIISNDRLELAMLSRLRCLDEDAVSRLPDVTEGLDNRFLRYAKTAPSLNALYESVKTKRYALSRIRRITMCACLGITSEDANQPPKYARVLAANKTGCTLLRQMRKTSKLPIITKPASAKTLPPDAQAMFNQESAAHTLYALAYKEESRRAGNTDLQQTPYITP